MRIGTITIIIIIDLFNIYNCTLWYVESLENSMQGKEIK